MNKSKIYLNNVPKEKHENDEEIINLKNENSILEMSITEKTNELNELKKEIEDMKSSFEEKIKNLENSFE